MSKALARIQARNSVLEQLSGFKKSDLRLTRPAAGWIRTIRQALGMSASDLARRLGVEVSTVSRIEANEVQDRIKLETMRKVADQLECDLVYVLVPRKSIEKTVRERAVSIAEKRIARLQQTMMLEEQGLSEEVLKSLIQSEADKIATSGKLWQN